MAWQREHDGYGLYYVTAANDLSPELSSIVGGSTIYITVAFYNDLRKHGRHSSILYSDFFGLSFGGAPMGFDLGLMDDGLDKISSERLHLPEKGGVSPYLHNG